MAEILSKLRRRKARFRQRMAERGAAQALLKDSPVIGFLYVVLGLAAAVALLPPARDVSAQQMPFAQILGLALVWAAGRALLAVATPEISRRNHNILLFQLLAVAPLAGARALTGLATIGSFSLLTPAVLQHVLPYIFAPLLGTLLFDRTVGLAAGLTSGLALTVAAQFDLGPLGLSLAATLVCVLHGEHIRTRSQALRLAVRAAVAQAGVAVVTAMAAPADLSVVAQTTRVAATVLSALGGAAAALLALPLMERLFGVTSDIALMSFADLGHPLLQRLALEAPGTYHHSLVVANLAQAAVDRIGANGLKARVCAYYHDIGKLSRPQFFTENQTSAPNPHDELPPNLSRMIITNHVKEGLCLAQFHRLPPPIVNSIQEHHGTSVITWFHHKARVQNSRRKAANPAHLTDDAVEESHYRYGGPLPSTRETTVLMLADAVEAASRSLARVTPTHIDGMVSAIVERKLLDGQLDDSPLNFTELATVKASFVFTLTHLLHARIAYPTPHANLDSESTAPVPARSSAAS